MDGYLSNKSLFKEDLIKLISDIPTYLTIDPTLYFINNKPCKIEKSTTSPSWGYFIENLNSKNSKTLCPPDRDTKIDKIIDLVTSNIGENVNIVISDCIFSMQNVDPSVAEADLKVFISKKIQLEDISTIVLKFKSDFSGLYYVESDNGKPINASSVRRPYYVLIFGKEKNIRPLLSKLNFKGKYNGFENSYCLLPFNSGRQINAVIRNRFKKGSFSIERPATSLIINNAKTNSEGDFQFSIDVNLANIGIEEAFLTNPKNYSSNSSFKILDIQETHDQPGYTHNITVSSNSLRDKDSVLIGLKYEISDWVKNTGTNLDNNPFDSLQQTQTYGFSHLMNGISTAYSAKFGDHQIKIPIIRINKGQGSSSGNQKSSVRWYLILIPLLIIGFIIWQKNKK